MADRGKLTDESKLRLAELVRDAVDLEVEGIRQVAAVQSEQLEKMDERLALFEKALISVMDELKEARAVADYWANPKNRAMAAVVHRCAKRAGMTVQQWIVHCELKGIPTTKMDRSIPNHSPGGHGGTSRQVIATRVARGEERPSETAAARLAKAEADGQTILFPRPKKKRAKKKKATKKKAKKKTKGAKLTA